MSAAPANLSTGHLPRVRLFRSGTYDQGTPSERTFSARDLDAMVRNYWLLCHGEGALYQPLLVIGHDDNTDLPAAGLVRGLWREGRELFGSFGEMPEEVQGWMNRGLLRSVSIEVYDSPEQANIPPELARGASGPLIRRVSLLGGHPPNVKGLGNPPWKFGENQPARRYGEASMDRDKMLELAKKAGFGQAFLDSLQDDQLGILIVDLAERVLGPSSAAEPPASTAQGEGEGGTMSREELIQALVGLGQDQATLEGMDDAALKELYAQLQTGGSPAPVQMGERGRGISRGAPVPATGLSLSTIRQYSEATARATVAKERGEERKQKIGAFCDQMVRDKKLTPAEGGPDGSTRKRLLRASAVSKFGEGKSELELQMEEIASRPASRVFGERLPQAGSAQGDEMVELRERTKKYAERAKRRA